MAELTPEEKHNIYLEEKARIESQNSRSGYSKDPRRRANLVASSSYAIAISLILLIGFNFFNQFIALYRPYINGDTLIWIKDPILTSGFYTWLPILNAGLVLTLAGHIVIICIKQYLWEELTMIILNMIGITVILALLHFYPFDFSVINDKSWVQTLPLIIDIVLGLVLIIMAITVLVRSIKLIFVVVTKPKPG
jgi:hypothetical protein